MATPSVTVVGEINPFPKSNSVKPHQNLIELITLEHNYCKPWSEREKLPHARPAVNLFASQVAPVDGIEAEKSKKKNSDDAKNTKTEQEEEIIDVDSVEEPPPSGPGAINIQYDVVKSKIVMSECEKYVNSTSSKRTPDTWEELICRTGWTTQQNVLFDKILKIVSAYRLSWLTYKGSNNEPILRRIALDKATKKVRQILSRIEWDAKLTNWLHGSMLDGLSTPLLACYLDIVQTLRSKVPTLVDKILAGGATHRRVSAGSTDNLTALLKRPWDATVALSSYQRPRKILGTPLLLIVPNGPTTNISGNSTKRSRFWHHHLSHFGKVIPVTMHLSNSGRGVSIGQCLDHMIGAVQAKVLELKNHFPNRPVILIGWATGALVSFQVSLRESVCAIVCLGFPMLTVDGIRGTADDPFLESKIPTLFVYGTLSTCCSLTDIEEFRSKLLADTSLLVVSGADGQLRLTSAKKKKEGVTQSVVDRRIMDDIGEFVNRAVSNMKDDTHPRLDYYDFDDFEIQRKKSKSVYRKRSSVDGQVLPSDPKKPRGRTTKAVNSEANSAKKAKPMKKPTVKKSLAHAPGTDGFGTVTSVPAVKPVSIPITSLHTVHPGVLQGVPLTSVSTPVVPISGVPVSRVSIPGVRISGLSIPVTGVNVPVSAVFKQGSLGGGSLVFSGATGVPGNPVGTTSGIKNMGGKTHLKIVVNPTSDAGIQLSGTPATTMISEAQAVLQYKNAIGASVSKSNAVCLIPTSSKSATGVATTTLTSTLVTSSPTTRPPMTSTALTSALIVSSGFISEPAPASNSTPLNGSSLISSKSNIGSETVSKTIAESTQALKRPAITLPSSIHQVPLSSSVLSTSQLNMAVRVGGSDNKSQQTVNNPAMKPLAASDAKTSQVTLNQARSTPSPQSIARTIQVGVKRTVTYNPVTSTKNVTVLSRNSSPESLSHINLERLRAKLKTIQHLTGLQSGSLHQMKHVQTLTNPASQNLPSGSNQPAINLVGQTSSSVQHPSKSSTHGITMTTSQAIVKSDQRDIVAPLTNATSKTDLQPVKSSTVVINQPTIASIKSQESRLLSASSAQATAMTVNPTTTSSSTTKTNSAVSLAQRVSKSEKNANESPLDTSISVKSSAMSVVKQGVQTVCKPATHFIQVPGSTKFSTINKSSSQSLSMLNVQSNTKIIGTQSSVPIIRANSLKSRAPSVASSHVPSTTTSVVLTRNLESSAKSDQSVDDSSKSDEEKLAERINSIVKEVVGGQQRTTRQSVRRLVAAAKVAEAQHKISESGEESQDQTTQK